MMPIYPEAAYLCVEALPAHEPALKDFAARHPNVQVAMVAAGNREGEVNFYAAPDNPFGGAASLTPFGQNNVTVPMTTLDRLCETTKLSPPYLLKLDAHAFEVPILEGATKVLSQANLLIIEAYNLRFRPGMLLFYELCQYLDQRGFHCLDLMAPTHRPRDHVLWQMDLVFARADRPEFQAKTHD
jgi:FkbM family methyltransferase